MASRKLEKKMSAHMLYETGGSMLSIYEEIAGPATQESCSIGMRRAA